jgi:uncharacterized protein
MIAIKDLRKKPFLSICFILVILLMGLWLKYPIEKVLNHFIKSPNGVSYLPEIISRAIAVSVGIYIIQKLYFTTYTGFKNKLNINQILFILVSLGVFVLFILNSKTLYNQTGEFQWEYIIEHWLVAIMEEVYLRGLILPLIILATKRIYLSVLLSSLIFALLHYVNLFNNPDSLKPITEQVSSALFMGVLLTAIFLQTNHLLMPILVHFLFNIILGTSIPEIEAASHTHNYNAEDDQLADIFITGFIVLISWLMLRSANVNVFLQKLEISNPNNDSDILKAN